MMEKRAGSAGVAPTGGPDTFRAYLAVRLQVLFVFLVLMAGLGLLLLGLNAAFDLSRKSNVLVLVLGIYVVFPVGFVLLAVRRYLRSQTPSTRGQDG